MCELNFGAISFVAPLQLTVSVAQELCRILGRSADSLRPAAYAYPPEIPSLLQVQTNRYNQLISKDPSFYKAYGSMGRALLHAGQTARAIEMLERCCVLGGSQAPTIFGALGQAYGLAGDRAKAGDILLRLRTLAAERPIPATCFALTHLGLGDREAALTCLESGFERRESSVVGMAVHPAYDDLRTEARFRSLVHRVVPPTAVLP